MDSEAFGVLDVADDRLVDEYESLFHRAYSRLADPGRLLRRIWHWDDERRRLRTRVPYRHQVVYTWRDPDGTLVGAMAANLDPMTEFQSGGFGFTLPPTAGPAAEILNLMNAGREPWTGSTFRFVRRHCFADLARRGFGPVYATCATQRLRPYLRLGATVLAAHTTNGEERHLLRWPLSDASN